MRSFARFLCVVGILGWVAGCSDRAGSATSHGGADATGAPDVDWSAGGESASADAGEGGAGGMRDPVDCTKQGPIDEDTIWAPLAACPDGFEVPRIVEVRGAGTVLTVEPGTKLTFGAQATLEVLTGAALVAAGTESEPIMFTGWQALPGSWGGIIFHSNNLSNEVSHAVVEYGGNDTGASANISLSSDGDGRVKLTSTMLRHGGRFGLTVLQGAALTEFSNNVISDNTEGAARVEAPVVHQLAGTGNMFTDNGNDNSVRLETDSLSPVVTDVTWPNLAPAIYRVVESTGNGGAPIYVEAHLSIEAGAVFEFVGGSGFKVQEGAAGLSAVGTQEAPIIFRGVDGSGWNGIGFCESNWSGNALEFVEVHNAKGAPPGWDYCGTGAPGTLTPSVLVGHNFASNASQLRVKNVTFAGPNNANADIGVKKPAVFLKEGTNAGTGADGALKVVMY